MKSTVILLGLAPLVLIGPRIAAAQSEVDAPKPVPSADGAPPAPVVRQAPPGVGATRRAPDRGRSSQAGGALA